MNAENVDRGTPEDQKLTEALKNKRVETRTIEGSDLHRYYRAGRLSRCEVWIIARPGETYLTGSGISVEHAVVGTDSVDKKSPSQLLKSSDEVPEGSYGVAIERLEDSRNFDHFKATLDVIPKP